MFLDSEALRKELQSIFKLIFTKYMCLIHLLTSIQCSNINLNVLELLGAFKKRWRLLFSS